MISSCVDLPAKNRLISRDRKAVLKFPGFYTYRMKTVHKQRNPVRFLQAQFNAASEKDLTIWFYLRFADGLAVADDAATKLIERLAQFAIGAALVEAFAEAAP